MDSTLNREVMDMDVLLVGGGPANLACGIHLMQLVKKHNLSHPDNPLEPEVFLIEKGLEIGHHQMSGAVMDPRGIAKLFPDWKKQGAPYEAYCNKTNQEGFFKLIQNSKKLRRMPTPFAALQNHGKYVISLQQFTHWLGQQAEELGVQIFSGFAGSELLYNQEKSGIAGVVTRDMGRDRWGEKKPHFESGMELRAKVTVLGEGTRGSLAKEATKKLNLDLGRNPQVYQLGCKEVWQLSPKGQEILQAGDILHTLGWPLSEKNVFGGGWIYGMSKGKVSIGLVCGLDYHDPRFDPHAAFQEWKTHPWLSELLEGGELLHYGAKTIPDGGYFSQPELSADGMLMVGDSAGMLNPLRLKGIHLAIESGMMAAETLFHALLQKDYSKQTLQRYQNLYETSEAKKELWSVRNFRQGQQKGELFGMLNTAFGLMTNGYGLLGNRMKLKADYKEFHKLAEPGTTAPTDPHSFDEKLTFSKLKDVYYSGTSHEEDQPLHLQVTSPDICITQCYNEYGNPCQHFCPAQVYEMVPKEEGAGLSPQLNKEGDGKSTEQDKVLKINASNCVHCKTCDIKDPYQIIEWVVPEGGGGPVYTNC